MSDATESASSSASDRPEETGASSGPGPATERTATTDGG